MMMQQIVVAVLVMLIVTAGAVWRNRVGLGLSLLGFAASTWIVVVAHMSLPFKACVGLNLFAGACYRLELERRRKW